MSDKKTTNNPNKDSLLHKTLAMGVVVIGMGAETGIEA
jgi:hypothetical protein